MAGILFTAGYIIWFEFLRPDLNTAEHWWLGISTEGIGTFGMLLNFLVAGVISHLTPPPPQKVQRLVESVRIPRGAGESHEISG